METMFKPLKIKERLEVLSQEVNKKIKFLSSDTLTFFGNIDKDLTPGVLETLVFYYPEYKINVVGNVDISTLDLEEIPVRFNTIVGCFNCGYNKLKTLKNSPIYVKGTYNCCFNNLKDFMGAPKVIGRDFNGFGNHSLESEVGKPNKIGRLYVLDLEDVFKTM